LFNVKDAVCIPGNMSKPCEDAIGFGENYCFVIDGASGLSNINIVEEPSDAAWFAVQVKEKLCRRLNCDNHTPTETILTEIIQELNMEYCQAAAEKGVEPPSDSPSAGIVLFRQVEEQIEFFGLGDCTAALQLADNTVSVLKDTRLCVFDGSVLEKMMEIHQTTGISVLEAREVCNDLLLMNRARRNQEDGYWILDLSGVGIGHALKCCWPADSVKMFFACSDGFAQLTDTFGLYADYPALLDAVQDNPLRELCDTLFSAQEQDPQANRFPRFKLRDDTSCLWGEMKKGV